MISCLLCQTLCRCIPNVRLAAEVTESKMHFRKSDSCAVSLAMWRVPVRLLWKVAAALGPGLGSQTKAEAEKGTRAWGRQLLARSYGRTRLVVEPRCIDHTQPH